MSVKKTVICDVCNKEPGNAYFTRHYQGKRHDLCEGCLENLRGLIVNYIDGNMDWLFDGFELAVDKSS